MNINAVTTVLIAPAFGATTLLIQTYAMMAGPLVDAKPFAFLIYAYVVGLLLTLVIGLPVGFLFSLLLRRLRYEGLTSYSVIGAVAGFVAGSPFVSGQAALPAFVVGLYLGIGYWSFVRRPATESEHLNA